ncbi:hypothetical protein AAG906_033293 [Vitis piasezkii]
MDRRQRRNPSASSSASSSQASSSSRFRCSPIEKQMWEATKTRARGGRRARSEQSSLLSWNLPIHVPWTFPVLLPFMPPVPHADVTTLVLFCTNGRKILVRLVASLSCSENKFIVYLEFTLYQHRVLLYHFTFWLGLGSTCVNHDFSPTSFELGSMKRGWMWAEEGRFDLCAAGLQYQFVPELDKAHKLVGKFHYLVTTEFRSMATRKVGRRGEENPNCQLQSSGWHSAHLLTFPFDFDLATDTA